jgi:hypothetical protein
MLVAEHVELKREDREFIDSLVARHKGQPGVLLTILEAPENHPRKYLVTRWSINGEDGIPTAQVSGGDVSLTNLKPQGDHTQCICRGRRVTCVGCVCSRVSRSWD